MSEQSSQVYIPVFSFNEGSGEAFLASLGLEVGANMALSVGGRTANFELFPILEGDNSDLGPALTKADAIILVLRFFDRPTMSRARTVYQLINHESFLPKSLICFRDGEKEQFKISCGYCGQKLWVRDQNVGHRGNCPQCRKIFVIPDLETHVISSLMLTESVSVDVVRPGNDSGFKAVESLVRLIINKEEGLKSSTMKIELPDDNE